MIIPREAAEYIFFLPVISQLKITCPNLLLLLLETREFQRPCLFPTSIPPPPPVKMQFGEVLPDLDQIASQAQNFLEQKELEFIHLLERKT